MINAFTIKAWDGALASSSTVQVKLDVAAVNDAPTLSTVDSLTGALEDAFEEISFSDLAAVSNEADVDGDSLAFRIESLSTGTLQKWNASSLLWESTQPGSTLISASEKLRWKGSQDSNGELNAFTIKAWDGALASSSTVQVKLDVAAVNDAPTLSVVNALTGAVEDTFKEISFSDLAAAANEADVEGDSLTFRIESLSTGTLQKWNASSLLWESVQLGSTRLSASEKLQWKGPQDSNGELNAFTIKAWDGALASSSAVQVKLDVAAVNDAPTLSTVNSLTGALEDTFEEISFSDLASAANEADVDGDFLSFRIESLSTGKLQKWNASSLLWESVQPGLTLISASEKLQWKGSQDSNGELNAFTIKAWDGALASSSAVQIKLDVAAVNDKPIVNWVLEPLILNKGSSLFFTIPDRFFTDPDSSLSFFASTSTGDALPSWLSFNAATRTLSGTPTSSGTFNFSINAADELESVSAPLTLKVREVQQLFSSTEPIRYLRNKDLTVPINYSISDASSSTGLAFKVHFDSSLFSFDHNTGVSNEAQADLFQVGAVQFDIADSDNDPTTDRFIPISIASFSGQFAGGSAPIKLADLSFSTADKPIDPLTGLRDTSINFSETTVATGYGFASTSASLQPLLFNLDVDGDEAVTALGDGLMIIRKLFGAAFAGDALTNKAISPDATRTTKEIHDFIQSGIDGGFLDVDKDGATTALGDGLMVIRRLFGPAFAGDKLIDKAISPDSPFHQTLNPAAWVGYEIDKLNPMLPEVIAPQDPGPVPLYGVGIGIDQIL